MSYQPIIPFGGLAGWSFLMRTQQNQKDAFNGSPALNADTDYFRDNISKVSNAQELVSDRRLLSVALGAFGLDSDINNKYFVQKVLDDGVLDADALSNKLSDKRYKAFAKAFGFGDFETPNTQLSDFPEKITSMFREMQFEVAIGRRNPDMRLAAGVDRELSNLLENGNSDTGLWFGIMGTPSLRKVFETALSLPESIGSLDLDLQLKMFRQKAKATFGSTAVSQFSEPEKIEDLVQQFLLRSNTEPSFSLNTPGSVALSLLQSNFG